MAERNTGCSYTGLCNFSRSHAARMWELRGVSPPDRVACPDRAGPWLPGRHRGMHSPVLVYFLSQRRDIQSRGPDRACTGTAPLPALPPSRPGPPPCLSWKGLGPSMRRLLFFECSYYSLPRCQCRLAGPLPCPPARGAASVLAVLTGRAWGGAGEAGEPAGAPGRLHSTRSRDGHVGEPCFLQVLMGHGRGSWITQCCLMWILRHSLLIPSVLKNCFILNLSQA